MRTPVAGDLLIDITGAPMPCTIANVHNYDPIEECWHVSTAEGVTGSVYWSFALEGWVWL